MLCPKCSVGNMQYETINDLHLRRRSAAVTAYRTSDGAVVVSFVLVLLIGLVSFSIITSSHHSP